MQSTETTALLSHTFGISLGVSKDQAVGRLCLDFLGKEPLSVENGSDPTEIRFSKGTEVWDGERETSLRSHHRAAQHILVPSRNKAGKAAVSCWRKTQTTPSRCSLERVWIPHQKNPTRFTTLPPLPCLPFLLPTQCLQSVQGLGEQRNPCLWNAVCCRQCRESRLLTASHKPVIFGVASEEATSWNRAHLFCVSLSCHFLQGEGKSETTCLEERAEETPAKTNDCSSPLAIRQGRAGCQPRCSRLCRNLPKNNENSSWLCWQILLVISCCLASSGYFPTIMGPVEVLGPSNPLFFTRNKVIVCMCVCVDQPCPVLQLLPFLLTPRCFNFIRFAKFIF